MLGETKPPSYLVDYGIHKEQSDMRAHVCVLAGAVYIFPTRCGVRAIESGRYVGKTATQPGHRHKATAFGYPVPVTAIDQMVSIGVARIIGQFDFREDDTTSTKGDKAVRLVAHMLRNGIFPLPVNPQIALEHELQISGTDIEVRAKYRIQVKCDYKGGIGPGCTGNVYLQTAEINPFKNT
jgi:hypothetical protein